MDKIIVFAIKDEVFFHVPGDERRYYDLDNVGLNHSELIPYIEANSVRLNREMFKKKELLNI